MKKLKKTILRIMPIFFMYATKVNAADVVSEVQGGGSIQSSKLGQGLLNIVRDITGTMHLLHHRLDVFRANAGSVYKLVPYGNPVFQCNTDARIRVRRKKNDRRFLVSILFDV